MGLTDTLTIKSDNMIMPNVAKMPLNAFLEPPMSPIKNPSAKTTITMMSAIAIAEIAVVNILPFPFLRMRPHRLARIFILYTIIISLLFNICKRKSPINFICLNFTNFAAGFPRKKYNFAPDRK